MIKDDYLDSETINVATLLHDELLLAIAERVEILAAKHELELQLKDTVDRRELLEMIISKKK